jgi:hypothetical protein
MKPTRPSTPWRLRGAIFALSIAAMATQAGRATVAPGVAGGPPVAHVSAASVSLPGGRELLAWLASELRGPPASGSWMLLLAGLTGVWAIGRRRVSALGSRTLHPHRLLRRR